MRRRSLPSVLHWAFLAIALRESPRRERAAQALFQEAQRRARRKRVKASAKCRRSGQSEQGRSLQGARPVGGRMKPRHVLTEERFRRRIDDLREGERGDKRTSSSTDACASRSSSPASAKKRSPFSIAATSWRDALIDDKARSADRKAHETDATVLSIERATLTDLSMDPNASLHFPLNHCLCRRRHTPDDSPAPRPLRESTTRSCSGSTCRADSEGACSGPLCRSLLILWSVSFNALPLLRHTAALIAPVSPRARPCDGRASAHH